MIASERSAYILKRLEQSGIIDYKNISRELNVSEATVRRDFEKLEKNGQLRRVQGGAVKIEEQLIGELSIIAKNKINVEEKRKVAIAAAMDVSEGESIFLDSGTSIVPLAGLLMKKKVHIVTNNNLILQTAPQDIKADVFSLGGRFCPSDQMFVGSLTVNMLAGFTFNRAFIGCMGIDISKNAVYVTDMDCLAVKQMAMRNADKTCLLTDSSKENMRGLFRLAGHTDFDRVYVNKDGSRRYPDNFIVV